MLAFSLVPSLENNDMSTRLRMCQTRYPLRIVSNSSFKLIFLEVRLDVKLPFREGKESEFHCHLSDSLFLFMLKLKYSMFSI